MKNLLFEVIKRYKFYIGLSTVIYLVSIIIGLVLGMNVNLSTVEVYFNFWDIFLNNLKVGLLIIFIGLITVGIGGLFIIGYNGFYLGYILSSAIRVHGLNAIITAIAPHFLPEMMATFLCCALGFESRSWIEKKLINSKTNHFKTEEYKIILVTFIVSLVLYAVAALIETNISYL
ncbi:stage II sporulation protein M [Anaerobranca gottschalkii]|uniref:Stage II sporulation protein M n=1 Tax=Anaerobranca gottschalkii DSM 13577 TaxID=1120990 RepID=A0A1I0CIB6_9FIRM|nr:stage II sporulation protein M [Anaerobranca gottschalkii]SET19161.1 Stage II sporulation protein M [Anaerobranca gottschalkii DSM 13577]